MKRIAVLAWAALGLSSPLAAEQTAPPAPQAEQLPPPPPMPPMPNARHRWVDIDGSGRKSPAVRPARHTAAASAKAPASTKGGKSAKANKHAKASKSTKPAKHAKASKSDKASKHAKASAQPGTDRKDKAMTFSAKTVRACHAMTYRQIMRSSSCRAMIKQELSASSNGGESRHAKPAGKKAAAKKAPVKKARRHSSAKRTKR